MPCFNAAPYVGAAVRSALDQTWREIEIIVINDGSTDSSGEILDSIRDSRVTVVHQDNAGQCVAANRALRRSSGEYIKFFDADDLIERQTIELQVARLAGNDQAVASCEWGRFYNDDLSTFRLNPEGVWRNMDPIEWLLEAWHNARPMMQCALWLIPRAVLRSAGEWDERLTLINDFEFFTRVLCHSSEVRFTPGGRVYYRSGVRGSLSGRKDRKATESAYLSITGATSQLLNRRSDSSARMVCANILQDFIYSCYPEHPDLRKSAESRIREFGGSRLSPDGPPGFHKLRRLVGWKMARRIERRLGRQRAGGSVT